MYPVNELPKKKNGTRRIRPDRHDLNLLVSKFPPKFQSNRKASGKYGQHY